MHDSMFWPFEDISIFSQIGHFSIGCQKKIKHEVRDFKKVGRV
jgi:hypothetical protein